MSTTGDQTQGLTKIAAMPFEARDSALEFPVLVFERRKTGPASAVYTPLHAYGAMQTLFGPSLEAVLALPGTIDDTRIASEDRHAVKAASLRSLIEEKDLDITFRVQDAAATRWLRVQAIVGRIAREVRWAGICTEVTDLVESRESAEAARAAKDLVLVNVSHELRAPLQAIVGFADFLTIETNLDRVAANANSIKIAASSVLAIVNQLLGVAEADAVAEETVRALAEACLGLVGPHADEKGLSTTLDVASDVPKTVILDRQKLSQALLNLLNNAVKFTDAGTVSLRIDRSTAGLRFSVADTGIGIKLEERGRLFQRFSRIDAEPSGREGTGLGLSITKGLVEDMGGTIDVVGNDEGGTTFWFEVPFDLPPALEPVKDIVGPEAIGGLIPRVTGSRVLLADDLDLNRKLIADMLSLEGHQVDCVADGAAAVAAASATAYDLILMDMIMPVMDGITATRAIRAMPAPTGDVPIVALTANSFPEQLDSCLNAGMDATLTKPMSIDALTRAVSVWTRRRPVAA